MKDKTAHTEPSALPPASIVGAILQSIEAEALWRAWGFPHWAEEEVASRQRLRQELALKGYRITATLFEEKLEKAKKKKGPATIDVHGTATATEEALQLPSSREPSRRGEAGEA